MSIYKTSGKHKGSHHQLGYTAAGLQLYESLDGLEAAGEETYSERSN